MSFASLHPFVIPEDVVLTLGSLSPGGAPP